ncbi:MAG TPA: hypothetical protein ENN99_08875 [Chloroflexi bacterium]|nr:hypothetical protein [Chloroflexota bacterium]
MAQTADDGKERGVWIKSWAAWFEALGLLPVALLFLELARAFGFLADQVLLMIQPLTMGILSDTTLERASALLCDSQALESLQFYLQEEEREC